MKRSAGICLPQAGLAGSGEGLGWPGRDTLRSGAYAPLRKSLSRKTSTKFMANKTAGAR